MYKRTVSDKKAPKIVPQGDKKKALELTLSQIEKAFGEGSIMTLGKQTLHNIDSIPTGAMALDVALGIGGVPRGRVIEVFGPESSGKTTLCLSIIAQAQRGKGIATQTGHKTVQVLQACCPRWLA